MQPAAFFAADGYYNTAPGSTLSLVIQPNYYDAIVRARSPCVMCHMSCVIACQGVRACGRLRHASRVEHLSMSVHVASLDDCLMHNV